MLLALENLRVDFVHRRSVAQAVRGVSLHVESPGQTVGVVGESGSGKSVTALAIMQLIREPPGRVAVDRLSLDGVDLVALPRRQRRAYRGRQIAMVFQEPMTSLDPVFTIGAQMQETIRLHQGLGRRPALRAAGDMLAQVDIAVPGDVLGKYPDQLSGGMRQRVMIAMALSCSPRLLIADEPTTALDVTVQAQVLELVRSLQERLGMAVIIITHDLGVIAETADRVYVVYGGKVLEQGPVEEIFAAPAQPYTRALLASQPVVTTPHRQPLAVIEGSSPSPLAPPAGCPFQPRCPAADGRCGQACPPPVPLSASHWAACWQVRPG